MVEIYREIPFTEANPLIVLAYQQRLPLKEIDLLQTPHKEIEESILRCRRTEIRAKVLIATLPFISRVYKSSEREDHQDKIDLWAEFVEESDHKRLPIQVKSSQKKRNAFLNGPHAKDRRIVGINAGPFNSNYKIVKDFVEQLRELDGYL